MKTKRLLFVLLTIAMLSCCWVACESDSSDYENFEYEEEYEDENKDYAKELTRKDSMLVALMSVVQSLCVTDSTLMDKLQTNIATFQPEYGMVVYSISPTVRYVVVDNADEARMLFINNFFLAIEYARADTTNTNILINLYEYGSIEYTPAQSEGSVAVINVDIPCISDLTQVVCIIPEATPQNDDGQLRDGNVLRYKDGRYWVCIRTARYGGLLVTFDSRDGRPFNKNDGESTPKPTWVDDPFCEACGKDDEKSGWIALDVKGRAYINIGFPSVDDLNALRKFLYDDGGNIRKTAQDALTFAVKKRGGEDLYNNIFTKYQPFCCGTGVSYWTGDEKTYRYKKNHTKYIWPFGYKNGWHEHECKYNTRRCKTTWYQMGGGWFHEYWNTIGDDIGSWPQRCISEPTYFIRTEMKKFYTYDVFYDSITFEGRNGWQLMPY